MLERGRTSFAVRPRVEGAPGVQRFYVVLEPESGPARRIVVGKKRLPAPSAREREWAAVERIGRSRDDVLADLGPETYPTKTRGLRHQPGVRIVAEGTYAIVAHGTHAHLVFVLEPDHEPLDELNVPDEGSLVVAVFNPLVLRSGGGPSEPSVFPDAVQVRFGERRSLPLEPALLDHEGAELLLLGAQHHIALASRPELAQRA